MSKENLHLPKTAFSMKADLAKKEPDILSRWEQNKTFEKIRKNSLGKEKLADIYAATEVFFCNVEEAQTILNEKSRDVKKMIKMMHELGPKIVCITDGKDGAYAYDSYNDEYWFHPIYPDPQPPVERTGAGDSFSSTFTIALGHGKTVAEALSWGPINSMNVVQYIGAQEGLLTQAQLEEFLANAPDHYKPEKI